MRSYMDSWCIYSFALSSPRVGSYILNRSELIGTMSGSEVSVYIGVDLASVEGNCETLYVRVTCNSCGMQ